MPLALGRTKDPTSGPSDPEARGSRQVHTTSPHGAAEGAGFGTRSGSPGGPPPPPSSSGRTQASGGVASGPGAAPGAIADSEIPELNRSRAWAPRAMAKPEHREDRPEEAAAADGPDDDEHHGHHHERAGLGVEGPAALDAGDGAVRPSSGGGRLLMLAAGKQAGFRLSRSDDA